MIVDRHKPNFATRVVDCLFLVLALCVLAHTFEHGSSQLGNFISQQTKATPGHRRLTKQIIVERLKPPRSLEAMSRYIVR